MRKIILSVLGILFIIGAIFVSKSLISSKNRPKPVVQKVVKTVFVDTVKNKTIEISINYTLMDFIINDKSIK